MNENRNFILAIVLSVCVLIAWQYFVVGPKMEEERARQLALQQSQKSTAPQAINQSINGGGSAPAPTTNPLQPQAPAQTREQAINQSPRILIDTPRLKGSIALKGGTVDDLHLKGYRETVEKSSANITLFSPLGSPNPYYAHIGFLPSAGSNTPMPTPETVWQATSQEPLTPQKPVVLIYENGAGLKFTRTISVDNNYMFTISDKVENTTSQAVTVYPYALISRHNTPSVMGFFILHEGLVGFLGSQGLKEVTYADIDKAKSMAFKAASGWMGITDKYWSAALIPSQNTEYNATFRSDNNGLNKVYQVDYLLNPQTITAGASNEIQTRLFAGAKEVGVIDQYRDKLGIERFDLMIDWGWFYFLTKPFFSLIDWLYKLIGNFGLAILAVTVIVKAAFFPLANASYVSMSKMKIVQPEMIAIRDKYKDDKMKQQQELMELYKREKINPLSGCLPVLLQIPVFFALYKVLFVTIEMRHAPFYGWINDLAAPDPTNLFNLFGLLPFTPPAFLALGAWPIIMGITMWLQMKLNPAPTDNVQKIMFDWMPLLFTFMLASFPAGLVIYWAWNNVLSIAQQSFIMKRLGAKVELWDNIKGLFVRKSTEKS